MSAQGDELAFLRGLRLQVQATLAQVNNRIATLTGAQPTGPSCPNCGAPEGMLAEADEQFVCGACNETFTPGGSE